MKLLALDQASLLGWACGSVGERPRWGSYRMRGDGIGMVLADYRRWLYAMYRENKPDRIIFESPYIPRPKKGDPRSQMNPITLRRLLCFAGYIEEVCATLQASGDLPLETKCLEVTTAEVSSFLMLPGRMKRGEKKRRTLAMVRDHYGFPVADDNCGDAVAIWLKAEAVIAPVVAQRRGVGPLQLGRIVDHAAPSTADERVRLS